MIRPSASSTITSYKSRAHNLIVKYAEVYFTGSKKPVEHIINTLSAMCFLVSDSIPALTISSLERFANQEKRKSYKINQWLRKRLRQLQAQKQSFFPTESPSERRYTSSLH